MNLEPGQTLPTLTASFMAGAILAAGASYLFLQASSLRLAGSRSRDGPAKRSWPNNYDVTIHPDSSDEELMDSLKKQGYEKPEEDKDEESSDDDEDDGELQGELADFKGNSEECKLVLVVRTDLGMGKGKIAAQCSHATLACYSYFQSVAPSSPVLKRWKARGQAKIAVQCNGGEDELLILQAKAISLGLCAKIIRDAGRTQIASGSATVLGIGPGPKSVIDQVTGGLKLL